MGSHIENIPYTPVVPLPLMSSQAAADNPHTSPSAVPTAAESVMVVLQVKLPTTQAHKPLFGVGGRLVLAGQLAS